jgi:hypothetical protein
LNNLLEKATGINQAEIEEYRRNAMKKSPLLGASFGIIALFSISGCGYRHHYRHHPEIFVTFADGSHGTCTFMNKDVLSKYPGMGDPGASDYFLPFNYSSTKVPGFMAYKRLEDPLKYNCNTNDGREATGIIESKLRLYWSRNILEHEYPDNVVIPLTKGNVISKEPEPIHEWE